MTRPLYTPVPDRANTSNPLSAAWLFGLAVLLLLPALLFSSFVPEWMPPVALVGLGVIFLLRTIATGRLTGQMSIDWPLLVLLLLLPLNLWISSDPAITLPRIYAFVANLALFWAVAAQRDMPWLHWSGWLLLGTGLVLSGVLLLGTSYIGSKLPFVDQDIYQTLPQTWRPFWNPAGFNPNLSGGLLVLFWPPAVLLLWYGKSWQQRDVAKLVAVVLGIALILTQSRGALLGAGVAFLVISVLLSRYWLWFWLAVLFLIGWGIYYAGSEIIVDPLTGSADIFKNSSLQSRQVLREQAFDLMLAAPLTGVGLGLPGQVLNLDPVDVKHIHNLYLQTGTELGLPGLLANLVLYITLCYLLLQRARDHEAGYYRTLALGLLGTLIVFLTHGFFEVITYAPRAAIIVWGLFGLMIAVATRPVEQEMS
jgi:O-antigen ligase